MDQKPTIQPVIENTGPPAHLSKGAEEFFMSLQQDFGIYDSAGLALLTAAAECWDRVRIARERIAVDGDYVEGRYSQVVVHPAIRVEKDARGQFMAAIKALNLDLEPLRSAPGRPPGQSGSTPWSFK